LRRFPAGGLTFFARSKKVSKENHRKINDLKFRLALRTPSAQPCEISDPHKILRNKTQRTNKIRILVGVSNKPAFISKRPDSYRDARKVNVPPNAGKRALFEVCRRQTSLRGLVNAPVAGR